MGYVVNVVEHPRVINREPSRQSCVGGLSRVIQEVKMSAEVKEFQSEEDVESFVVECLYADDPYEMVLEDFWTDHCVTAMAYLYGLEGEHFWEFQAWMLASEDIVDAIEVFEERSGLKVFSAPTVFVRHEFFNDDAHQKALNELPGFITRLQQRRWTIDAYIVYEVVMTGMTWRTKPYIRDGIQKNTHVLIKGSRHGEPRIGRYMYSHEQAKWIQKH